MSDIRVNAIDQNLMSIDTPDIFSGDVNSDRLIVDFDSTWDDFTKTAVFYVSEKDVYKMFLDVNNTCVIPHEVLKDKGKFYFGILGVNGDKVLTTEVIGYKVGKGAVTSKLVDSDPTPDIYEQILFDYDEIKRMAKEWDEKVDPAIQEAINAKNLCNDAVSALQLEFFDMNGGDPFTSSTEYEFDINGGYPN